MRFPEFSDTWENKKLGEIGNFIGGGTPSTKNANFWNGDVPWISSSDISDESIYKINKSRFISREAISQTATKLIPAKSILIVSRVGVGKVAINETEICTSQDFTNLIVELDNYIFLAYLIKFKTNKLLEFNQGTSIKGFVKSDLENLEINIPSLPEQTKIATFLTAVDEKLTQLKQKKELLSQYKNGIMQQIFSQKLRFKDDNGNDFEDWEEKKLGEVSDVRDGTHDSQKYIEKGYPFITSKNLLKNGNIDFENVSYISEKDYKKINERSKVNINDILFGMIGTIGNPVLVKNDGFAIKNVALIKEKKGLLNIYLIHFLKGGSITQQFFEQNTGGTQKFLSLSVVRSLLINLPCLSEQTKIANFLSALDEKISNAENKITKLEQWKKGLLQSMFC